MADQDTTDAANTGDQSQVQTIRINNEDVPIADAPAKLAEMEHSIKSGYNRKLEEERATSAANLRADTQWYAQHDTADWDSYEPLVGGGRGWTGTGQPRAAGQPASAQQAQSAQPTAPKSDPFSENALSELRAQQARDHRELEVIKVEKALAAMDKMAVKYPDADTNAVKVRMQVYHQEHGYPAPADEIETFLRMSHEHTSKKVAAVKKGLETASAGQTANPTSALPSAGGGGTASTPPAKAPSLINNLDELIRRTAAKL
jgi:hypothetical protein